MFKNLLISDFSKTLAKRLLNITGYKKHKNFIDLLNIISFVDFSLSQGNSCLPTSVIKESLNIDNTNNLGSLEDLDNLLSNLPNLISTNNSNISGKNLPLIYENGKLSFKNSYQTDKNIESYIKKQQTGFEEIHNLPNINLDKLDIWQKIAVITSATHKFSIISGGAGTGKTTVLSKILEIIFLENKNPKIILAAPTGKAANRLQESILKYIDLEMKDETLKNKFKTLKVKTIHQILAISQTTGEAFNNQNNPLFCDFIAIDEASMVASNIFTQIISAIPKTTKLLLLGDENQLGAVNTPSFFNNIASVNDYFNRSFNDYLTNFISAKELDCVNYSNANSQNNLVLTKLKKSFRFDDNSIIYKSANLVLKRNFSKLILELEKNKAINNLDECLEKITNKLPKEKEKLLDYLDNFIVLCAKKKGWCSCEQVNKAIDNTIRSVITKDGEHKEWYLGKRIIIEKNYYALELFNGDVGKCIWVKNNNNKELVIDFGNKIIPINKIPEKHSLAYAISIHKSQGSEYNNVEIIIDESKFLNNAIIYTAITRAKKSLIIYCEKQNLINSILKIDEKHNNIQLSK